ncbi:MAG TPA: hypothetical protein VN213_11595 [Solirubrobacteraceae bacterium]|nr:hypothetical protein [Solirubrobacteraceae bacterium]
MPGRVVAPAPPALAARFAAAAAFEPLSDLAPGDRAELAAVLAGTAAFEDLPGRWQAALLTAETRAAGGEPPAGGCCGG